ncbi:tripartite tricarboxylate transporter substrate binding protein [Roseomonas sp. GC11]|uniref:tripartite tricarboxylate transporter substrate binding protein n=1 Tax=Roseomonas sp. GC11 TaxID=2950546 RepID=UPI00210D6692|nr:tripartite tricarboxylate transporter substrate binding protein [Roseomonas sp. GC11]MCQ4160407.1 tripartite tricarboxylate transporter substrate binding protein [Roseomonas sp. GC11]
MTTPTGRGPAAPISRRGLGLSLGLSGAALLAARPARAASWPAERTITVIVPFPPGGGVDQMARLLLPAVQKALPGASFVVENRAGAGSQIGLEALFSARPDGYTLGAISAPVLMTMPIERPVRYRVQEFGYIANVVDDPGALWVRRDSPIRDFADLIARARQAPGTLSFGTTGIGSDDHLVMLELEQALPGLRFSHVPFNGSAPLQTAVLGGHLDVGCFNVSEGGPGYRDGRFRGLAQAGAAREPSLPEVPTLVEQGVAVVAGASRGILAPPGLPAEILAKLEAAFAAAMADPGFQAEAQRAAMPLKPQTGAVYRQAVLGLDGRLKEMWARKPWRDQ